MRKNNNVLLQFRCSREVPSCAVRYHELNHSHCVPLDIHPIFFDSIDEAVIRSTSLHTRGASVLAGLHAYPWRRLHIIQNCILFSLPCFRRPNVCVLFYQPRKHCTSISLPPHCTCQERWSKASRCIIIKAVLAVTRGDIQDLAGSVQL